MLLTILAIVALCVGVFFLAKYFKEKKKAKEEGEKKEFIVTAGLAILAIWLFPGLVGIIIFFVLLCLVIGSCGCVM